MKTVAAMKVHIEAADPVTGMHVLRGASGRYLMAQEEGRAVLFQADGRAAPLGSIVPGCAWAGSIWIGAECIGEYERREDAYRVTPIEDGNKQPDRVAVSHPVDFLLARIERPAIAAATPGHVRLDAAPAAR